MTAAKEQGAGSPGIYRISALFVLKDIYAPAYSFYKSVTLLLKSELLNKIMAEGGGRMRDKVELNIQIGRRIKEARKHKGYTQEELAEEIGVSVQYTSDLERGRVGTSIYTLVKICQALGISSDYLLFDKEMMNQATIFNSLSNLSNEQLCIVGDGIKVLMRALANQD